MNSLDARFWNNRYLNQNTGWDLGEISPPLKAYIDQIRDKNLRILIPGCGNSYEADYLLQKGFTNITVIDIAPALVKKLQEKYAGNSHIQVLEKNFFDLEGEFDLLLEQTFFCALYPALRPGYVGAAHGLLSPKGKLVGLLFNRAFEEAGPPFGGSEAEYKKLFESSFEFVVFAACYNSFPKRQNTEVFIILRKK